VNELLQRYDEYENGLVREFHGHPFFLALGDVSNDTFERYLLQRSFLSLEFVKWEEIAKLGLTSEQGQQVVRRIIREEVPPNRPTHKDDLLYDLNLVGISTEQFRSTQPTAATAETTRGLYDLVRYPQGHYDLRVLVVLRVAGEIFVAETYRYVVQELERRYGITSRQSKFYWPHFEHDQKGGQGDYGVGHADSFDAVLGELIVDEATLAVAQEAAREGMELVYDFHSQFVPVYRAKRMIQRLATLAAAACLAVSISFPIARSVTAEHQRQSWQRFLAAESPAVRAFFLECDEQLLARIRRSGDTRDLSKVGTAESARAVWGDGP